MKNVPTFYISVCFLESISQKSPGREGSEETSSLWKMRRLAAKSGKRWSLPLLYPIVLGAALKSPCSEAIPLIPDATQSNAGWKIRFQFLIQTFMTIIFSENKL